MNYVNADGIKDSIYSVASMIKSALSNLRRQKFALYACGLSLACLVTREVYYQAKRRYYNYPPGHNGIPLFGSFISFAMMFQPGGSCKRNNFLQRLHKRYGPISLIQLGVKDCIFIHDYDLMRQLGNKHEFMIHTYKMNDHIEKELTTVNGVDYLNIRAVFLQSFVSVLNPKYLLTHCLDCFPTKIYPNLDCLVEETQDGNGVDVTEVLSQNINLAVFSTVFTILFGNKGLHLPEETSDEYKHFQILLRKVMQNAEFTLSLNMSSPGWFVKLFGIMFGGMKKAHGELVEITKAWVDEHNRSYRGKKLCAVDNMLAHEKMKNNQVEDVGKLVATIFESSTQSTQEAVVRTITTLAKHEESQKRIYKEIKEKIDKYSIDLETGDYPLSLFSHGKFDLLRACVSEQFRMITIVGAPRTIVHDNLVVAGYNLPKGATLLFDYIGVDTDEKIWEGDTSKYDIDRWLKQNEDGSVSFQNNNKFAAFGIGKRSCPGKAVGYSNVYHFLAVILVRYRFSMDKNQKLRIEKRTN